MKTIIPTGQMAVVEGAVALHGVLKMSLESDLTACFETWNAKGTAGLVSSNPFKNKILCEYLTDHRMEATTIGPMIFDRGYSRFIDIDWGLVIICLDDFNGIGPIFNKLRYFRNNRPDIPVILTSFGFKAHDLTEERLQICDASIRFPLESTSLDDIFLAAWKNNNAWVARLAKTEEEITSSSSDN